MIVIKRLENPTGMMPPGSEHRANADVLVILDEKIKEIADLCVRAYAKGELSYCRNVNLVNEHYLDAAMNAMLGGNLSLESEYWRAHTRATALEGELDVIINEGQSNRIVSVASLFGPERTVFGR